ncbi:ArnT family glycosyltransferase [Lentzea flaviverrucosa]|uniref:4-amino-4-deoxy-L-arabinose transferase n=1 Tax=Lentzea flaviverrucosa TaxID=200379 RepID=A0A1H9XVW8_9PSEU|nr:glycosyltransferase family 39 protein [Lentzea flaviverrucosa]RDI18329.1 4-amino-4-deoxy-L-arabinose transferase-like glycosyltransferase [Lentzea flaviverrucosa]SES50266.1 4-amino-4-deoxy-L-arabinose transferase [Lentzea flaviverrucosa]
MRRERLALAVLLIATGALYLWRLGDSGWANAYYSAAAQAGATSWKAWFFGSSDASNAITVDKTPASLWVMGLSARLFGVNAWSILVPQALMGVGSVWLLHATVRRWFSPAAALISGAVLALTPVAVLMFRFNNPDALLVLLLIAGAYCVTRAVENAGPFWLALAGVAIGFGFLTKMLQAFLVLPAFALVYLLAAPTTAGRKVLHLTGALGAMIVAGGWWVAAVELTPDRPYIGGSQTNSVLELTLGYNGIGRLTGDEVGSVGGGRGWGTAGWSRLLSAEMGSQIAWLLPAAVVLLVAGLWLAKGRARTALALWGGWLVVTAGVFSFMNGIIHSYYTVALAPAIAAVVGIAATELWERRSEPVAAAVLSGSVALSALQCYVLVNEFSTPVAVLVLMAGLIAAVGLVLSMRWAIPVALIAALLGPTTYSFATVTTPHTGALPVAGPSNGRMGGMGGGLLDATTPDAEVVALLRDNASGYRWAAATIGSNNAAGLQLASGQPVMALGGFNGTDPAPTLEQFQEMVRSGQIHYYVAAGRMMQGETGSDAAHDIAAWVAENYTATTVAGATLYPLDES